MSRSVLALRRLAGPAFRGWLPAAGRARPPLAAARYSTEGPAPPPPVVPVADPPAAVDPEVRNLLQSLGLGGHEAALVAKGGVSGMADLQGLSAASLRSKVNMSGADAARLRAALQAQSLDPLLEAAGLPATYREKFAALGVWDGQRLRQPQAFVAVSKLLKPQEFQALLLTLSWYTLAVPDPKAPAAAPVEVQVPQEAPRLLGLWMEAIGRKAGHRHRTLEDAVHEVYFRVDPAATESAWQALVDSYVKAKRSTNPMAELAKDLVARLLPTMEAVLPVYLGALQDEERLVHVLHGLLHPQSLSQVLSVLQAPQDDSGVPQEPKRQRLPRDLLLALRVLYAGFPDVMAEEWAFATQSPRTRAYYRHLTDVLRAAIAAEKDPKRLKPLREAAATLQRTRRLPAKGLPAPVRAQMEAWKAERAVEDRKARWAKARTAHWTRVMSSLPNDLLYSCSEVNDVADFWDQPFFERMMVWWKLNAMYDLQFPDFHHTAGRGRELQPTYRSALIPDELDRSL